MDCWSMKSKQPASGSTGHRPVAPGNLPGTTAVRSRTHHAASKIPCAFCAGSATVPVAPVGVPPTGSGARQVERAVTFVRRAKVFGGTPKTAGETPALPPTPTALPHSAQGCRVREATLGGTSKTVPTLKGLNHRHARRDATLSGLGKSSGPLTQGSSCVATLGWRMEPRWSSENTRCTFNHAHDHAHI